MLSDQIITFATLFNVAVLLATLICLRKMSGSSAMQHAGSPGKMMDVIGFPDFELPGLPPVKPEVPENVGKSEIVTSTPQQASAIRPGRSPKQVMRASGFAPPSRPLKAALHPAEAADLLIATMNAEGQTGLFTATEIDRWWEIVVALEDIEEMSAQFVRSAMTKYHLGQKRLNTPEYRHVRQRTGQTRAILYRIPKCRALSGDKPAVPDYSPAEAEAGAGPNPVTKPGGKPVASRVASQQGTKNHVNAGLFAEAA